MEELAYIVLLITTPTAEEAAKKHGTDSTRTGEGDPPID